MDERFFNPHAGEMSFEDVVATIVHGMEEDPKARYEILIGTDSSSGPDNVDFVSAIVLHKLGKGGRYFWTRQRERLVASLRQKIWREAWLSFELAQRLLLSLSDFSLLRFNLEIHVDIGESGRTKEMIDEVVGMIIGSGFSVRIKPHAYAASSVADKYT
ncbi:MAG: ribonuclease H-like YkuK family protein [Candidatus Bipolaricaulota bacterium]|jgi:predicted RNase H-related nuclease YkuK (DUF458 family)|nr:ribonuclease H-like YkuK family protein [Candidatus Bipolaricaulota bacterium]